MAKPKKGAKKTTTGRTARKATAARKPRRAAARPSLRTLTPYLPVNGAAQAIDWYRKAFGAKEVARQSGPDGKVMHAHLRIGDSDLFLSDIFPGADVQDAARVGPTATVHLWSRNVDKLWQAAVQNGAKATMPLDDQFWGDRYGKLVDPFGHSWSLAWKSKLPKAELERKREEAMKQFGASG